MKVEGAGYGRNEMQSRLAWARERTTREGQQSKAGAERNQQAQLTGSTKAVRIPTSKGQGRDMGRARGLCVGLLLGAAGSPSVAGAYSLYDSPRHAEIQPRTHTRTRARS